MVPSLPGELKLDDLKAHIIMGTEGWGNFQLNISITLAGDILSSEIYIPYGYKIVDLWAKFDIAKPLW